jgi:hypothetical protein
MSMMIFTGGAFDRAIAAFSTTAVAAANTSLDAGRAQKGPELRRAPSAAVRTVFGVPRISFFYGIAIWMYWNEGVHARAHFHARYAGQVASVDLDGELLAGSLPNRALALVAESARLHRDELHANWERARREEPLQPIDPLP